MDEVEKVEGKYITVRAGGGKYSGPINLSGKPHGFGTMEFNDGTYIGHWFDGLRHGEGKMTWSRQNGSKIKAIMEWFKKHKEPLIYSGPWVNDKPTNKDSPGQWDDDVTGGKSRRKRKRKSKRNKNKNRRTKRNRKH